MAKIGRVFLNRSIRACTSNRTRRSPTAPATPTPSGRPTPSAPTPATCGTPTPTPACRSARSATPGDAAINGGVNPADGDWLFFVTINLKTGETVFSETADEHEAAAAQLHAWCRESAENASYCA